MTTTITPVNSSLDPGGQAAYPDGFLLTLLSAAAITATDNTNYFQLPYMTATGKVKLVVNISALAGGSSPTLTLGFYESVDAGASYNPTAALTTSALNATGVVYTAVASGPIYPAGRLAWTVGGTGTPTFTVSAYLVGWNR